MPLLLLIARSYFAPAPSSLSTLAVSSEARSLARDTRLRVARSLTRDMLLRMCELCAHPLHHHHSTSEHERVEHADANVAPVHAREHRGQRA